MEDLGSIDLSGFHWVIVGGESGFGARTMKREWVVSLRRECRKQNIPFFFKQWGGVRKSKNGRMLDGRTYDEMPIEQIIPKLQAIDSLDSNLELSTESEPT
jgi:protein gp37